MQQRTLSPFFATLLACGATLGLGTSGGCSLALDTQKVQCTKASDCVDKTGGSRTQECVQSFCQPIVCETLDDCRNVCDSDGNNCKPREGDDFKESYCAPSTPGSASVCQPKDCTTKDPECEPDSQDNPRVCNLSTNQCLAMSAAACQPKAASGTTPATNGDEDCDNYAGLDEYICENKKCAEPQCKKDSDCKSVSDSASCVMGRCDDITWGCIGEQDDREVPASGTSTLKVRILKLLGGNIPLRDPEDQLVVKVCSVAGDPNCEVPIPTAVTSYDSTTGMLTITGLQQKQKFWLSITAKDQAPVDWYAQRTPIGVTEEPEPIVLVPPQIGNTLGTQFDPPITVDLETKATLIIRIYNCLTKNGEGLSVSVNKTNPGETVVFYLNSMYTPLVDAQETDNTGTAGVVNVPAIQNRVIVTRGSQDVTEFDLPLRTKVLTYLALYPRDYSN